MGFKDDANRARAATLRNRAVKDAADQERQWADVLERLGLLEDEMRDVKERMERLESPSA